MSNSHVYLQNVFIYVYKCACDHCGHVYGDKFPNGSANGLFDFPTVPKWAADIRKSTNILALIYGRDCVSVLTLFTLGFGGAVCVCVC